MDVAYYISDLLQQQGELSVPNLGYFVQMRVSAHYNDTEKKFFPPRCVVHFDPQVIDDDNNLATYITSIKNISLASAKYFIEKYISGLKEQVIVEDVSFANLGTFSSDGLKLIFKPADQSSSPDFFGSPVIDVSKNEAIVATAYYTENTNEPEYIDNNQSETVAEEYEKNDEPVINAAKEPPIIPPIVNIPIEEDDTEFEDEAPRKFFNFWTITVMALAAIAIALFTLYKLRPGMFGWYFSLQKNPYIINHLPAKPKNDTATIEMPALKPDSTATDSAYNKIADTTAAIAPTNKAPDTVVIKPTGKNVATTKPGNTKTVNTSSQPTSTAKTAVENTNNANSLSVVPKSTWVIYAGAFPVRSGAEKALVNYKSMGFAQARLLTDKVKNGNNYKIIMGYYPTRVEATDAKKELLMTNKFRNNKDLSVEFYK